MFLRSFVWPRIPTLRIASVTRISLDRKLATHFARLKKGLVLDVGAKAAPYLRQIPHTQYVRLDITEETKPDICCDIHAFEGESDSFDTVIAIEILEHLYDPQRAIDRVLHVLKPGGVCIASTRFLFRYHPDPKDYYRFTWDSLEYLFRQFSHVEVHHHGSRVQAIWEMINAGGRSRVLLNALNPVFALFESQHTRFPLGFVIYAQK